MNNIHGTTSAYAENTAEIGQDVLRAWNHLRVRGEYPMRSCASCNWIELPPRTRRIPLFEGVTHFSNGTTSAYAENTRHDTPRFDPAGNYLRVRGEYVHVVRRHALRLELPPRTRRIRECSGLEAANPGTTSAYAENTHVYVFKFHLYWNYLRVRGEYAAIPPGWGAARELPPRTRRIHPGWPTNGANQGTTSAYAENTHWGRF